MVPVEQVVPVQVIKVHQVKVVVVLVVMVVMLVVALEAPAVLVVVLQVNLLPARIILLATPHGVTETAEQQRNSINDSFGCR